MARERRTTASVQALAPSAAAVRDLSTATRNTESRHDKFVRIGNRYMRNAMYAIRRLDKLSNYDRSQEEVDKIAAVLVSEVEKTVARLRQGLDDPIGDIL